MKLSLYTFGSPSEVNFLRRGAEHFLLPFNGKKKKITKCALTITTRHLKII